MWSHGVECFTGVSSGVCDSGDMITLILLVFAFVCFVIAAFGTAAGRFNLIAAGLAFWSLSAILAGRLP